jgi:elongation factor 1-gamma
MPNASNWLIRILAVPEVVRRLGNVKLAAKTIKPQLIAPPKEEKKVVAKAAAKDDGDDEEKPVKKEANPLDVLPPSPFDLFSFKTFFVNHPDRRGDGMKFFFENYDKLGYCIYFLHYEMYEGEGQVIFQTANMLNGFLQRIDHFRKHTFASLAMLGEEPKLQIEGVWLFRGKGIP